MGLLSDFFIAEPVDATTYGGEDPYPAADCCQYKDLSPLQAAQILAVLRGVPYDVSLLNEFPLVHEETDEGPWTVKIPDDMVAALAQLKESDLGAQSLAWSEATKEELNWDAAEFEPIVRDLIRLARAARGSGKSLFLWNCL
jgi:hypothetical protein